ncbi:hypothetical protein ECG_09230 [Echinococcus granulosus]|uniref:Expressed conserved protein n=1 Tax=Echinococcus granulosus TaxID=6210 RepID=A0A068WN30_ECHGR|nr:hypothetical protein ECG_09230 [Echinococcus granulosus]CDS21177.1 expressed conserved protein [Echinococcus granulosus]
MGLFFSKSSSNTNENAGQEHETMFQQFTNSIRRSFRSKRPDADNANRPGLHNQPSAEEMTRTTTRVRPPIPESFHQPTAASVSSVTASKEISEQPAKCPTPAEAKVSTPKTLEVAPAIARMVEAPQHTAFIPETPKNLKGDREREGEVDAALDVLKGAIHEREEQEEKKDDKKDEEKDKLNHVGGILSQLAPADISDENSPETEAPAKPAVSLMAALERRKAIKEQKEKEEEEDDEEEKEMPLSHGVTNVLESIAVHSSSIRSHEAANLMATFTIPPHSASEEKEEEEKEEQEEEEDKKESEEMVKEELEDKEDKKEGEERVKEELEKKEDKKGVEEKE